MLTTNDFKWKALTPSGIAHLDSNVWDITRSFQRQEAIADVTLRENSLAANVANSDEGKE